MPDDLNAALRYLRSRDSRLAGLIETLGPLSVTVDPDIFSVLTEHIIGQQLSDKARRTICGRLKARLGALTPAAVNALDPSELRSCGMSLRKASCLKNLASRVADGELDLERLRALSDAEVKAALCALRGVGPWTAEMVLLTALGRRNIFSRSDAGLRRGLRIVYHHKDLSPALFEKYRRRFSPCCSLASLYFYAAADNAVPALTAEALRLGLI